MAVQFPTALDDFTNPAPTDRQNVAVGARTHAGMHADTFDALEALQAKVGITASAEPTSHDYLIRQAQAMLNSIYGDGSDGDVTIGSNTTLTRSMQYNNLTVSAGFTLTTDGYEVLVKGTLTVNGTISAAGNNGGNASGTNSSTGGTAGAAKTSNDVGGSTAGTAGASGTTGAGAQATNTNNTLCWSNAGGGTGGASGTGSGGGGVALKAASGMTRRGLWKHYFDKPLHGVSLLLGGQGGVGGGSGGGDGTNLGGGGGGAGSGGGILRIAARIFVIGVTGVLTAAGGNSGNGGSPSAGNCGGGGSGGSGAGGVVDLAYASLTNSGTITVAPGTLGTAGTGSGTGAVGALGTVGGTGKIIRFNTTTGAME